MARRTDKPNPHAASTGAVERLYMMYFAGMVAVLLAIIVLAIFTTSRLSRQADRHTAMVERIELLQAEIDWLGGGSTDVAPTGDRSDETAGPSPRTQPTTQPQSAPTGVREGALDGQAIADLYAQCVRPAPRGMFAITDDAVAANLFDRAVAAQDSALAAEWTQAALVSLAVLSRLLGEEDSAQRFSNRARSAGFDTAIYDEFTVRALLHANRPAEAGLFAGALQRSRDRKDQGVVLQALSLTVRRNLSAARDVVAGLNDMNALADYDRLNLARVYVELEQWDDLRKALHALDDVAGGLAYERDLLRSIWLIYDGSLAEADAVLAFLIQRQPGDYDAITWRGVVVMRAGQPQAARRILVQAADLSPGRPEAWFWLAVLEINAENNAEGEQFLNKALAASALYAPAWEALATVALKSGEVDTALDHLKNAVRNDSGRPNAHLLIALCHAQKSQRDQAAAALRTTFAIDAAFIERAAEMDALARMFDRSELEALLPGLPDGRQPPSPENP